MQPPDQPQRTWRYTSQGFQELPNRVITEASVSLTVNGEIWISFSCTPGDLEALAAGFLFNEGILEDASEIASVQACANGSNVDVWLNKAVTRPATWRRTSGCTGGVTGAQAPTFIHAPTDSTQIEPQAILSAMDQLLEVQALYQSARGVHCSALSDGRAIRYRAEDIGRHNTLDKLAGMLLLQPQAVEPRIILTTGRVSSEMLQKSARLGAIGVVSRTSPTSASVEMAEASGITLVGYARRNQFLVYAHPERFSDPALQRVEILPVYLHS